jgi:hypothetical protein
MQYTASELNKTNQILMELPLFQNLLTENEELEEQVKMLKHNIMYFESANRKMLKKVEKLKMEIKSMKKSKKTKVVKETSAGSDSCKVTLEEEDADEVVFIKQEKIFEPVSNNTIVIDLCNDDEPAIKMVIEETSAGSDSCKATLEPVDEDNEEEVEVEVEEDEVVEVEGEEDEVVEVETSAGSDSCKATLEGEEDEVVEGEEEVEEEVEVEGEGEEEVEGEGDEVVEGEVEEDEVVEVEVEEDEVVEVEGEVEETEEEDVYEIEINGKTYYVSNEKNSVIYAADEDGEITIEAGVYKNGKPIFN